jgi:hypothetical protein
MASYKKRIPKITILKIRRVWHALSYYLSLQLSADNSVNPMFDAYRAVQEKNNAFCLCFLIVIQSQYWKHTINFWTIQTKYHLKHCKTHKN